MVSSASLTLVDGGRSFVGISHSSKGLPAQRPQSDRLWHELPANYAFKKLRESVNKTNWISHGRPAVVNAYYSPLENSIQFPAGILQGAFFGKNRPAYLNYGTIGWVIGHEITHGFDDQGRQFGPDGNLAEWWESPTKKNYLERAQCIINQYGNYSFPELGLNINGINTQGENIAVKGRIKEASIEPTSNTRQYTHDPVSRTGIKSQLFWLGAANVWCQKSRPESLKLHILTGAHSPSRFRVRGPFANMPQFASDYNCPLSSAMNPVQKCAVW
ncbi:LOW QUALITY PROTEIN: neprilysin-2-like [Daphnia pulicaria]|uniref:LOW QUALITY PROTEIN: neprilysin-2-like n=1 Tax=Daphnia pulicaria TaxID=35523 RepID=UPI001EEBFD15|nr:LOW QUALITY PROTEIN: neprilysin-2-like [Daphnia pulicaria]